MFELLQYPKSYVLSSLVKWKGFKRPKFKIYWCCYTILSYCQAVVLNLFVAKVLLDSINCRENTGINMPYDMNFSETKSKSIEGEKMRLLPLNCLEFTWDMVRQSVQFNPGFSQKNIIVALCNMLHHLQFKKIIGLSRCSVDVVVLLKWSSYWLKHYLKKREKKYNITSEYCLQEVSSFWIHSAWSKSSTAEL